MKWLAPVVLVVAAVLFALRALGERDAWQERASVQADSARLWRDSAARAIAFADSVHVATGAVHARNDSLAAALAERTDSVRTRIIVVRDSAPPDPARDRIIDELVIINDSLSVALETERAAYESLLTSSMRLRAELLEATVRVDSLLAVIEDAPGPAPWWMPRVSAGYGCVTESCGFGVLVGLVLRLP